MRAFVKGVDALTRGLEVHVDASLPLQPAATAEESFEQLWSMLPAHRGVNRVGSGPANCFLKGQRLPLSWALRHWFRPPGICREVRALKWLRASGVPVPRVLGFGISRRCGILRRAWILLERIADAEDLAQRLEGREGEGPCLPLFEAVGGAIARMHGASLYHRNLAARNLVVRDGVSGPEVFIIDCPRAEWARFPARTAFLERDDRLKLARSVLRCGAGEAEVRSMLKAMGAGEVERIVDLARESIRRGRSRPLRVRLWLILGI